MEGFVERAPLSVTLGSFRPGHGPKVIEVWPAFNWLIRSLNTSCLISPYSDLVVSRSKCFFHSRCAIFRCAKLLVCMWFLVARSDSSGNKFDERALELRNCRKRHLVSRESSGVSRPFSSLCDRRGFPSSFYAVRSLAFSHDARWVSVMHEVWNGNALKGWIN